MNADAIRNITFPRTDCGEPPSSVHEFFGAMLAEIAAQLAELNANLNRVIAQVSPSHDGLLVCDMSATAPEE